MALSAEIAKLFVTVGADTKSFFNDMSNADGVLGGFAKTSLGVLHGVGVAVATATVAVGAAAVKMGVDSFNAAKDFESAFASVKKTVDETATISYADLEEQIRDLAKTVPTAVEDIAELVALAGQLGIETENVIGFSKAMIDLANTTNMSATAGAEMLAQFANITQMDEADFSNLGSAIVELGNNMATTEADIVAMSLRLAGAGVQVGLTEADIVGLAATLSSLGIESEAGGSAFSKLMVRMQLATETGGKSLEDFAAVSGMTAEEFSTAFEEDATGAIQSFISGLGELEENGESTIGTLNDMGITEIRMRDTLLRASGASDLLTDAINMSNDAWDENTAMATEAGKRYATVESQMAMLSNSVNDLKIGLGQGLLPSVLSVVQGLNSIISDGFQPEDIGAIGDLITDTVLGAIGGISSSLPGIISTLSSALSEIISVLVELLPVVLPALVDGALQLFTALINAITENAPMLGDMISQIITAIVNFIIVSLPMLLEAALQIIIALANGLAESLPELIPAIVDMLIQIMNTLMENLPMLLEASLGIILALIQGLGDALPMLIDYIPVLIGQLVQFILENLPMIIAAGIDIMFAIIEGLNSSITELVLFIPDIIAALIDAFATMDYLKIGTDIMEGIGGGIVDGITNVVKQAQDASAKIADAFKSFFGIASPSKLMIEYGEFIPEGFAVGIDRAAPVVAKSLTNMVPTDIGSTLQDSVNAADIGFSNIGVDNYQSLEQSVNVSGTVRHEGLNERGQLIDVIEQTIGNKLRWESMMAGG